MIAHNPPPGRAALPHPAVALGKNAHTAEGIGMTDGRQRQPASDETPHAVPKDAAILAAPRQRAVPEASHLEPKEKQRRLPDVVRGDFLMRPEATAALGGLGISRFPHEVSAYVHGVSDRAGPWHTSRYRCSRRAPPLLLTASASRSEILTRLNTGRHVPLPTLRRCPCEQLRMTRGRCGWLAHIRMTFAFTTPRRFSRRTRSDT
jgi:hypothetical protein